MWWRTLCLTRRGFIHPPPKPLPGCKPGPPEAPLRLCLHGLKDLDHFGPVERVAPRVIAAQPMPSS